MTFVAGYAPDERGPAALHLAALLARSSGEDLVVGVVVPQSWFPSAARIDAEYRESMAEQVDAALARARREVPDDVPATYVRHEARSVPAGVLQLVERFDARVVVVGSSSAGLFGHVVLGSVTDHLLHSSPVPVALAPRGFRAKPGARIDRLTVAYARSDQADALAAAAVPLAARIGATLRLATFAVWSRPAYTTRLGSEGEDAVLSEWVSQTRADASAALNRIRGLSGVPHGLESAVGVGGSWSEAIDDVAWGAGDLLLVGSSDVGPLQRVFLGSRASKIVRHSPIPVLVVPRPAAHGP